MGILLVVATGNQHKVDEISQILSPRLTCVPMRGLGNAPELEETGKTFEANAAMKATQLANWLASEPKLKFPIQRFKSIQVLADDSGLEVDFLEGAPGVYSARFAATDTMSGNAPDQANNDKLLSLLRDIPDEKRSARFRCVLALVPNALEAPNTTELYSGACEGRIARERHGSQGFGYDPLFYPTGYAETFAELSPSEKNKISHRAKALEKLAQTILPKEHAL
jgi:XTP/dITP diphosphohydrolase